MTSAHTLLCLVLCCAVLFVGAACQKSTTKTVDANADAQAGRAQAPDEAPAEHAPAGAKPGSHEDWCGEHGVPESLCSRCHPALVAAFKATGDWCAQHGLPESQCKQCNPDLVIKRPDKQP